MTKSIAEAFDDFKSRIRLTKAQTDTIETRTSSVRRFLADSFSASNMPVLSSSVIGSVGRQTVIRPPNDVDILVVFNPDAVWSSYRQDSRRLLTRVRDALAEYRTDVVGTRGQAVRLFYSQPPLVDVTPVFARSGGGYLLPAGDGSWIPTNPLFHNAYIADTDKQLDYRLKPLVRMAKRWNAVHSRRLTSFHLECVAAKGLDKLTTSSRINLLAFFAFSTKHIHVEDPAGLGGDLGASLTQRQEEAILTSLVSSYHHARAAFDAEKKGDFETAFAQWRILLGDEFPAYG